MANDELKQVRKQVADYLPDPSWVSEVEFEGPVLVLYSTTPELLVDNGELIRELAKRVRKRIIVRADTSVLTDEKAAEEMINRIVPPEAGITKIGFDPDAGEVIIDAEKLGLVIGKAGQTLRQITAETRWTPNVTRTPPIKSDIMEDIKNTLRSESKERKRIMRRIGRRIYRTPSNKTDWIRIAFLGGAREVGRSCELITTNESSVMLDCGVNVAYQDNHRAYPYLNMPEFVIDKLDAVVLSHAHLDHCGFVPYLYKYGYDGPTYCTPPTRDLMTLLQLDYLDVAMKDDRDAPYGKNDVKKMIKHTIPLGHGDVRDISPDVRLTLHNSGHILGSSIAHLHIGDGLYNVAYTGDFKFDRTRLLPPASPRFPRLEGLIVESTYGGSGDMQQSRMDAERKLIGVVNETTRRGGKVLVPVLSVGRAQEVMVLIEEKMRQRIMDRVPVYLHGMIWSATAIHTAYPEYLCRDLQNRILHNEDNPFVSETFNNVSPGGLGDVVEGEPCIILATSGMMIGGPVIEYFKRLAPDSRSTLVFVSYQAEGSLGRRVQRGLSEVAVTDEKDKLKIIKMQMKVITIGGFSGHSDRGQLLRYMKKVIPKPQRVLVQHGDYSKCENLSNSIGRMLRMRATAPQNLETIRLM
jgi:KH/beta-lactamase-domain protein